jgi:uncharacterized protein
MRANMSNEVLSERIFHNGAGRELSLSEVISEIQLYTEREKGARYEISIGSDSQPYRFKQASFVSAIVARRVGNGAVYFWTRQIQHFYSLQHRIQQETMSSILLAQECKSRISDELGEHVLWDRKIEIHLDIGEGGATRQFLDAMKGMVRAYQFEPVIKPEAYGAFAVADRHT